MSTEKRELYPNATYHVYNRGNNKMKLFLDSEDFIYFLKRVQFYKKEYKFEMYAYCLMSNHFHFLIKDSGTNLPIIMAVIESVYACYFIEKYKYKGKVFESRFKSNIITDDQMMMTEHRYINRNSVAAGIVANFLNYRWSAPVPENDKYELINFNFIDVLYKGNCKVGYLEYLRSHVDDLWIDPIEVCQLEDAEALTRFNYLRKRMNIRMVDVVTPVYNEKTSEFIYVCLMQGITKKQLVNITNLSLYKIKRLQETHKNFILPPGG